MSRYIASFAVDVIAHGRNCRLAKNEHGKIRVGIKWKDEVGIYKPAAYRKEEKDPSHQPRSRSERKLDYFSSQREIRETRRECLSHKAELPTHLSSSHPRQDIT